MRPLVLFYDGCCIHYDDEIVKKVILVILPANATHLIQPLDIAVSKPFKLVFKICFEFHVRERYHNISKKNAMAIGSKSWREGILDVECPD